MIPSDAERYVMTKTAKDTSESKPAAMPAFARMMRETRFAKGEEALIESADEGVGDQEKLAAA